MAELKNYEHADQIENPSDLQLSGEHENNRVKNQARIAQNEVNKAKAEGLSDFFEDETPDGRRSVENITKNTKSRVIEVITKSATEYVGTFNTSSNANLEKLAWDQYQGDVLDRIQDISANTSLSVTVAEGYESFLKEAKSKTDQEWTRQKEINKELVNQFGWWAKFFDKDKRYEAFAVKVDKSIEEMFSELNANVSKVKESATSRVENMESRIQTQWDSTFDPDQKQRLWGEIKSITAAPNIAAITFNHFNVPNNDQEKVDFVEALRGLDLAKNQIDVEEESKTKQESQTEEINAAKAQQQFVGTLSNYQFHNLIRLPALAELKASETEVSESELLNNLETELRQANIDLEAIYRSAIPGVGKPTQTTALVILGKYLHSDSSKIKHLSESTKLQLASWIRKSDENTKNNIPEYTQNREVQRQFDKLSNTTNGSYTALNECVTKAKTIKIDSPDRVFSVFETSTNKLVRDTALQFQDYQAKKSDFNDEDKVKLDEIWNKINEYKGILDGALSQWSSNRKNWAKWNQGKTQADDNFNAVVGPINATLSRTAVTPELQSELIKRRTEHEKIYNKFIDSEPILDTIDLRNIENQLKIWRGTRFVATPNSPSQTPLQTRLKNSLTKEFNQEIKDVFLSSIEKNDQFHLLSKASIGSHVDIKFKALPAGTDLSSPQQLDRPQTPNGKIVRIVSGKCVTIDIGGGQTLNVLGPAAKGGQPYTNAIIKNSHGQSTPGVAFNFKIN